MKDISVVENNWFLKNMMPLAFAEESEAGPCVIGDNVNQLIDGKCPTRKNTCDNNPNSFKGGTVYFSKCIERMPINIISNRCLAAAESSEGLPVQDYEHYIMVMATLLCGHGLIEKSLRKL